jgi:molybdopterin molybdotransferase
MRPGSPFSFGWLPVESRLQPVFGLPGNPASAFVTFEVFTRPFLLKLAGHRLIHRSRIPCVAGQDFHGIAGSTVFARVTLSREKGRVVARSTGPQGSGLVRGLAPARALALVPGEAPHVPQGAVVDALVLDDVAGGQAVSPWEVPDR